MPQGAVYGLVGSNGAGKTTAIRHITGIFRQDSGSVTIGGLPVYENPPVKSRIGYIPDDLGVFGGGTLRELAAFYRTMYPRFDAKRYAALRDVFRLDESTPLRRFSKGMQKHAAFWLTLCIRPDYLVLDEPESNLDFKNKLLVLDTIEDLAKSGLTCIFNTHFPAHALRRANQALLLGRGGKSVCGKTCEVVTEDRISEFFGVRAVIGEMQTPLGVYQDVIPVSIGREG